MKGLEHKIQYDHDSENLGIEKNGTSQEVRVLFICFYTWKYYFYAGEEDGRRIYLKNITAVLLTLFHDLFKPSDAEVIWKETCLPSMFLFSVFLKAFIINNDGHFFLSWILFPVVYGMIFLRSSHILVNNHVSD